MNIKNIINGFVPNGTTIDSAISLPVPVDISKAVPILIQQSTDGIVDSHIGHDTATVRILDSTTLQVSRGGSVNDFYYTVLIVEFTSAASVQQVLINSSQSSATISSVSLSNELMIFSSWAQSQDSTAYTTKNPILEVTAPTTLSIDRFSTGVSSNFSYTYIVEL